MAGGPEWIADRECEESPVYQKTAGGPWYRRKRIVVEMHRSEKSAVARIGDGKLGSTSGILMYTRARSIITHSLSDPEKFVCTRNEILNGENNGVYVTRAQTWVYESSTEVEL